MVTCKFTSHSESIHQCLVALWLLFQDSSVILEFLRFKAKCIVGNPSVVSAATPISLRVIPTPWASIVAPGRSQPFNANNSATYVFVDGFPSSGAVSLPPHSLPIQVSLYWSAKSTICLEALACFIHRVDDRHDSNIRFSRFPLMILIYHGCIAPL